ncbi:MAG TPA: hypothetical protein P5050_04230 [Bacteroidia bacterium]|nr:hypothetical protein [Sphingobacteriales bacterium]HPD64876.1 hypothetical protein [Bacteroidia bacterium]HRS58409.1 hypothetical protein [Bacteroidia bacterium]HRU67358.1 hypothetical protein [Bacteroidia bacterium]
MQHSDTWKDLAILSFYNELDKESELTINQLKETRQDFEAEYAETTRLLKLLDIGYIRPSAKCLKKIENYSHLLED